MQDQLPIGHPFNMSLKYDRAPAYPSQTSFSTPIEQRLSMSQPHDDERRLKVDEILPLLKKELSSDRNISQTSTFVDLLFPSSRLPFPVNDTTLENLAKQDIWSMEDARFILPFQNYKESSIGLWLNVVGRLIGIPHGKKRIRLWHSGTCNRSPEGSEHLAKPDLVLLDRDEANKLEMSGERPHWQKIRSFAEVTSQSPLPKRVLDTVDRKSYLLFLMQDNRRFVAALSFGGNGYFSLTLTDRQGQIRMSPITLFAPGKDVALLTLRILAFFMYAPLAHIGFDPSMLCDNTGKIKSIFVNDIEFIVVKCIYSLQALISRGTKVWVVRQGENHYILKDSWVLAGRVESEIDFLERFAECPNLQGSVPVLIEGEDLKINGELDSTERYRLCIGQINKHRVHRRLVTEPIGTPIVSFASKAEFLSVIIDAVHSMSLNLYVYLSISEADVGISVLQTLHDSVGVLHRDISPNNILYVLDESGNAKCILIDFDYAASVGRLQQASHGFRTVCFVFVFWSSCVFTCSQRSQGTPPFMALEIMLKSGENVRHELRHDLESLLYVVFWLCNYMIAPGVECELVDKNTPYIGGWCNMALSLQGLGHLKLAHIVDAERTILAEFTPYWEDFKPFAKRLLAEFFPVSAANPNKITSAKMLEILNEALSAVKEPGPRVSKYSDSRMEPRSVVQAYATLTGSKRDRPGQNVVLVSKRIKQSNVVSSSVPTRATTNALSHLESVGDVA